MSADPQNPRNPRPNLILIGPMGAGKSSVGRHLAGLFGLRAVDADEEIERRAGTSIASIFARDGEPAFRQLERQALIDLLAEDGIVLATGGGAVLDADNRRLLSGRGFVVHLHAGPAAQLRRLAGDTARPLLQGDDPAGVLQALSQERAPLYAQIANLRIDTDGLEVAEVALRVMTGLPAPWQLETAR